MPFSNHVNKLLEKDINYNNVSGSKTIKSPIQKIKELKELLDMCAITEEEFNNKKDKLMSEI